MQSEKLKVGITLGDMNGVGPEIILKTLSDNRMLQDLTVVVYGSNRVFNFYRKSMNIESFTFHGIKDASEALPKKANLVSLTKRDLPVKPGEVTEIAGELAFLSLEKAVADLASNKIDVLVTSPINKKNIQRKGFDFPGHTEYLAKYSNVERALMLMCSDRIRVGLVTGHLPINEVSKELNQEKIIQQLEAMDRALKSDFSIRKPKIAVLGLNPHAGDEGLLGEEEKSVIIPAINEAKEKGIFAIGPFPADGFFAGNGWKDYDAILAMYHDQGLIPFKSMAGEDGVNFTAGLPIVRTSPAHGTAYDIAGKCLANAQSFRQAIYYACDIYKRRAENRQLASNPLQVSKKD